MHHLRKLSKEYGDMAVSPVVGVMLMLVVTIIIAAVVSGFAGGLFGGNSNQKTPTLAMDVKIENSTSGLTFSGTVLSTSEPISTNKLKLSTSWAKNATIFGGNETTTVVPYGFGPGISGDSTLVKPYNSNQYFGNYTLTQGTGLVAEPSDINMILGSKYSSLSPGDTVNVKIVYVPTGKMVFQKDVIVTGV